MIGRSGERGSGISVLAAGHDDDDDLFIYLVFPPRISFISVLFSLLPFFLLVSPSLTCVYFFFFFISFISHPFSLLGFVTVFFF